jgi:hypothetical protein
MTNLFFLLVFLLGVTNLLLIFYFAKIFKIKQWFSSFYKVTKKVPSPENFRSSEDFYFLGFWTIVNFLNFLIFVVGLLTGKWFWFLLGGGFIFSTILLDKVVGEKTLPRLFSDLARSLVIVIVQLGVAILHFHIQN